MAVNMVKCSVCGSFYNEAATPQCPYCSGADQADPGATLPVESEVSATMPVDRTMPSSYQNEDSRTVPVVKKELGIDPVVGWLVAISGSEMGRDYKIHSDNNYIGRSESMDICIKGDDTISRERHAFVTYDSRDKIFYITPGEGRSVVRHNGKALLQSTELKMYDRIEVGSTELIFMPLCGNSFSWAESEA